MARGQSHRFREFKSECLLTSDFVEADFTGAKLDGSDISYTNATRANFRHASMRGVIAKGCVLAHAELDYADLTGANLAGCSDVGTTYSGATLTKCILPEGWTYEYFVEEVAPTFFALSDTPPKLIVSEKAWAVDPIQIAFPEGIHPGFEPLAARVGRMIQDGHLRRMQLNKAMKEKGMIS